MSHFIQLHLLTSYAPANINRDDLGRPKTAKMGSVDRLRISSQCLKRAWRTSDVFNSYINGSLGIRTRRMGRFIRASILSGISIEEIIKKQSIQEIESRNWTEEEIKNATQIAFQISKIFVDTISKKTEDESDEDNENESKSKKKGKKEKESNISINTLESEQIVFYTPEEIDKIQRLINQKRIPLEEELSNLTSKKCSAVDVAMFGRMLASSPKSNIEASVQVAHAITVNRVIVEDDYFTAVDDLNVSDQDNGSAHINESGFGSGVFYTYICINRTLLEENLGGNKDLAGKAIQALTHAAATVSPSGKQNSYASRAYAHYILAEKGKQQPRQLSSAFLKPIDDSDLISSAIERLEILRENMEKIYGPCSDSWYSLNVKNCEEKRSKDTNKGEKNDDQKEKEKNNPFDRLIDFVSD